MLALGGDTIGRVRPAAMIAPTAGITREPDDVGDDHHELDGGSAQERRAGIAAPSRRWMRGGEGPRCDRDRRRRSTRASSPRTTTVAAQLGVIEGATHSPNSPRRCRPQPPFAQAATGGPILARASPVRLDPGAAPPPGARPSSPRGDAGPGRARRRASERSGRPRAGPGARFTAGGGTSGRPRRPTQNDLASIRTSRRPTQAPTTQWLGYHRAPPGGYAADILTPGVGKAAPAMAVFEGVRDAPERTK